MYSTWHVESDTRVAIIAGGASKVVLFPLVKLTAYREEDQQRNHRAMEMHCVHCRARQEKDCVTEALKGAHAASRAVISCFIITPDRP